MLRFKEYILEAYHSDTYGAIGSDAEYKPTRKYGSPSPEAVERIKKKKEAEKKETGLYKKQTQSQRAAYVKNQMASLKHIPEAKKCNCWDGYKRVPGTKPCAQGSCVKEETMDESAVDAKGHKSSTGGLTQKGRDAYNAKGANLQAPVTTPPSELKKNSKAYNRRKSFCARMSGVDGPMKDEKGRPTRKALALRKWNC